ncbi:MAG: hypothetical protein ACYTG1_00980 [Planctomycetota bacterium]|jgi:hypothetical protein
MKRTILISSLVLNVLLAGLLVLSRLADRDRAYTLLADATAAEVRLQEHVLAQLEADPPALEDAKAFLRRNIEGGTATADAWRTAAGD